MMVCTADIGKDGEFATDLSLTAVSEHALDFAWIARGVDEKDNQVNIAVMAEVHLVRKRTEKGAAKFFIDAWKCFRDRFCG
jgi:hypothetical protein